MNIPVSIQKVFVLFVLVVSTAMSSSAFGQARIQIVHVAPFADTIEGTSVEVTADDSLLASEFTFGSFTEYLTVPAGEPVIRVFPTGTAGDINDLVAWGSVVLEDGKDYTALDSPGISGV